VPLGSWAQPVGSLERWGEHRSGAFPWARDLAPFTLSPPLMAKQAQALQVRSPYAWGTFCPMRYRGRLCKSRGWGNDLRLAFNLGQGSGSL
jgi:hypothetical protein